MTISLIRRAVMCAGIVALSVSLVGQTTMARKKGVKGLNDLKCQVDDVARANGGRSTWECSGALTNTEAAAAAAQTTADGAASAASAAQAGVDALGGKTTLFDLNCMEEGDIAVYSGGQWECESDLPRFVDNDDGTVTDNDTGLMWEQKLASLDAACTDMDQANRDVRCEQNVYTWTGDGFGGTAANGTVYTDFLMRLNDLIIPNDGYVTPCFAGHCDWRVPSIGELRSIVVAPFLICTIPPCIDGIFGPTASNYWSSSSNASNPINAWYVFFSNGIVNFNFKDDVFHVRAVRGGR